MLQLLKDIMTTTFLIGIPFTIVYAAFWIWLDKKLYQKELLEVNQYAIDTETYSDRITITYGTTKRTYFIPTYNASQQMYGPKCQK